MKSAIKIQKPQNFQLSNAAYLEKINAKQHEEKVIPLSKLLSIAFDGPQYKLPKYYDRIQNLKENYIKNQTQNQTLLKLERAKKEMEDGLNNDSNSSQDNYSNEDFDPDFDVPLNFANEIRANTDAGELDLGDMQQFWEYRAGQKKIKIEDKGQLRGLVDTVWNESKQKIMEEEYILNQEKLIDQCILDFEEGLSVNSQNNSYSNNNNTSNNNRSSYQNKSVYKQSENNTAMNKSYEDEESEEFTKQLIHSYEKKRYQKMYGEENKANNNKNNNSNNNNKSQFGQRVKEFKISDDISAEDYEDFQQRKEQFFNRNDPEYYFLEEENLNSKQDPFPFIKKQTDNDKYDERMYPYNLESDQSEQNYSQGQQSLDIQNKKNSKSIVSEVHSENNIVRDLDLDRNSIDDLVDKRRSYTYEYNQQMQQEQQTQIFKKISSNIQHRGSQNLDFN